MDICLLCGLSLEKSDVVKLGEKGLSTLVRSSKERCDGKFDTFSQLKEITLHVKCRRDYTRASSIKSAQSTSQVSETNQLPNSRNLRGSDLSFDFKQHCLFCSKVCYNRGVNKKSYVVRTVEIKNTIISYCSKRGDEWANEVRRRIGLEFDLVSSEARYHSTCYADFTHIKVKETAGRPEDDVLHRSFENLIRFLDENKKEICQFSLTEISNKFEEFLPQNSQSWTLKHLKKKLIRHYGSELVVVERDRKPTYFCFKGSHFDAIKKSDELSTLDCTEQRRRIIDMSASILNEEIRSMGYDLESFPTNSDIINGGKTNIPPLLLNFISILIDKGEQHKKVLSLSNAIIAAVRPRSYISPILFGIGVYIHRKYGSRSLIDLLRSLGFSESCHEILKFEAVASCSNEYNVTENAFQQFVFDNADHNIRTLDGHKTFHNMGGIVCISPSNTYMSSENVERPKKTPNVISNGKFSSIPIIPYKKRIDGLKAVLIKDINTDTNSKINSDIKNIQLGNSLWLSAFLFDFDQKPSWNGYMAATVSGEIDTSLVIPLPFINLEPSNPLSINSALHFAVDLCKKQNQSLCLVTFDQPLYIKAVEIVLAANEKSPLKKVYVRLGGFHLLMSYLGSVGYIMGESGLEEMWSIVYAKNSLPAMLNGHSYSRALRAHFLSQLTLEKLHANPNNLMTFKVFVIS